LGRQMVRMINLQVKGECTLHVKFQIPRPRSSEHDLRILMARGIAFIAPSSRTIRDKLRVPPLKLSKVALLGSLPSVLFLTGSNAA